MSHADSAEHAKRHWHWHWYYNLLFGGLIVVAVFSYSLFGGQTAIIASHVLSERYQGSNWVCSGPYLDMVKADQAFDQGLFSTCSKCPLQVGSLAYIGVATEGDHPLRANATLFKAVGVGFDSWDGC